MDHPSEHGGQNLIAVKVQLVGGDIREVRVNINNPLHHLLREGLRAHFPPPNTPDPGTYQLSFKGALLPDLSKKIGEVGIQEGDTVVLQPRQVGSG